MNKTIESYNNQKKAIVEGIRKSKDERIKAQTPEAIAAKKAEKQKQKNDLIESFKKPLLTIPGTTPVPQQQPSEADLTFFDQYGYLPPAQINEDEVRAKIKELGMPASQSIPHLDKQEKGKFTNARPEDREAVMTAQEKADRDERLADTKIQEEFVDQTNEVNLQSIEKSTATSVNIKISVLTYYTNIGDNTAQTAAFKNNKTSKKQGDKSDVVKIQNKSQKSNKTKKPKLEDNIKQTITQDITNQFKQTKEEEKIIKDKQELDKQDYLERAKSGKMQHNKMEQEMYAKDGIKVNSVEDTNTTNETKQTSFVQELLSLGGLKASAKGLNNAKYSLIIYANQNTNLTLNADSQNNFEYLRLRTNYGTYGSQRWCFDNDNNKIYLTSEAACYGTFGKKCIHALGGANYGGSVGLYDCNFQNGTDPNQKWFFDEEGRISLIYRQDMCIENASGLTNGNPMVMWGCGTGVNKRNQDYRAGYSNSGTQMGQTIWATYTGNFVYNLAGHAFVEYWNNYGAHNTFSRWPDSDYDCNNYNGYSTNNICDYDKLTVDVELDLKTNPSKYNAFKKRSVGLTKSYWDYVVFGSGYRSNYAWWGTKVDLGGSGTYQGNISQSRNTNYQANYNLFDLSTVCSGQSIKLWNTAYGYENISSNWYYNWEPMSPSSIYFQI